MNTHAHNAPIATASPTTQNVATMQSDDGSLPATYDVRVLQQDRGVTAHEATGQVPLEGPEGRAPGKHALEDAHQPHSGLHQDVAAAAAATGGQARWGVGDAM